MSQRTEGFLGEIQSGATASSAASNAASSALDALIRGSARELVDTHDETLGWSRGFSSSALSRRESSSPYRARCSGPRYHRGEQGGVVAEVVSGADLTVIVLARVEVHALATLLAASDDPVLGELREALGA